MKEDAEVLAESREYLEENGWWRGALVGPNGHQVCAMGAIIRSQGWSQEHFGNTPEVQAQIQRVEARLIEVINTKLAAVGATRRSFKLQIGSVPEWNDDAKYGAKDKQDVLDVFAKAEKIERAGFDPDAP